MAVGICEQLGLRWPHSSDEWRGSQQWKCPKSIVPVLIHYCNEPLMWPGSRPKKVGQMTWSRGTQTNKKWGNQRPTSTLCALNPLESDTAFFEFELWSSETWVFPYADLTGRIKFPSHHQQMNWTQVKKLNRIWIWVCYIPYLRLTWLQPWAPSSYRD